MVILKFDYTYQGNMGKVSQKAKQKRKSSDSVLRSFLADFLRSIPTYSQKAKSIDQILGDSSKEIKAQANVLLVFLRFFNVISVEKEKGVEIIKASSESASFFLGSLAVYVEQDLSLISNWEQPGTSQEFSLDNLFNWGTRFLTIMEERRISKLRSKEILDEVDIVLSVIKAKVRGYVDPMYLFQLNPRSLRLQMPGGYKNTADESREVAMKRHLENKLVLNQFDFQTNVKLNKVLEGVTSSEVSLQNGAYTKYYITLFHIKLNTPRLKLSVSDRWISLPEIAAQVSTDSIPIRSPYGDVGDKKAFIDLLERLSLSLNEEQEGHVPLSNQSKSSPEITNEQRVVSFQKTEESENLEFKSSARWDYHRDGVNKDLEKVIVKTIAGFMNSNGGTLVIGMSDDGEILGLLNDMQSLQKKNEDGYMQFIINLISSYIGIEFCSFTEITFEEYDGKVVCIIDIKKAPQPVFIKENERREFYARAGNTTRLLDAEEVYKYIHLNW